MFLYLASVPCKVIYRNKNYNASHILLKNIMFFQKTRIFYCKNKPVEISSVAQIVTLLFNFKSVAGI